MTTSDQPEALNVDKPGDDKPESKPFDIQIDREHYQIDVEKISGAVVRQVPPTPIPADRDIFQVVPGHDDQRIKDDDWVQVYDGLRFFTVPSTINPGYSAGRVN